jgi:hypothetical protein
MQQENANKTKKQLVITAEDGKPFKVPVEGSLGLLALGYKGLVAWRHTRAQYQKLHKSEETDTQVQIHTDIEKKQDSDIKAG